MATDGVQLMAHGNIDDVLENQNLKNEFSRRNLDLKQVWQPEPDDIENENCRLQDLLDWVITFEEFPNRKEMEMKGYQFPPVEPGISPDSDWLRFRKWVLGKPVRKTAISRLQDEINLKNPTELTDNEITIELKKLTEQLKKIHIAVDLNTGIPARLIYQYLLKEIKNEFELLGATGWWHIDGCSGYCPGCFSTPMVRYGKQYLLARR